ncbi:protein fem-1 homolog C-like isoform X1 [Amphibalanus amphitrite]|uniref:protein fem-1 homolog C-like isoform X1 n=2 Tax=Amphibalanus amphitrite TaxID=1232801 RepID=UPI001C9169DD|nr:protein fem-1 homolog C-like isoform X1 [Amphibalanus amphitrite]
MEFINVVFNAARDGKLRRLKVFLDRRPKDEVKLLVSTRTNGATPLVMACRNGHRDVAEYLLDRCAADPEQVGSVIFDGETIEGAPPLWCAAAAGHCSVVQLLVERGVNVNATTRTHSTPLRAACFDGHHDIAQYLVEHGANIEIANRHGHTCLMISCYKGHLKITEFLVSRGARVNRRSVKGNTALHDCAESGSLSIMTFLIENHAKLERDSYGITPLLAAAVCGHTNIVEYLLARPDLVTRQEMVDALELLGATYVDKKNDLIAAIEYWKRALDKRYEDPLNPLPKPPTSELRPAYENVTEALTHEELDDLISDPDEMRMQALIVRERILGPAHPDTSYFIRYRGAVYADAGNFQRCIQLWMYALNMQQHILDPLSPLTQSSLLSFAELFSFMLSEGRNRLPAPQVPFADIFQVFTRGVREVVKGQALVSRQPLMDREYSYFTRTLTIVMNVLCLLMRLEERLTDSQTAALRRLVYELQRGRPVTRTGQTPLHIACTGDAAAMGRYPICAFPSLPVVDILLETGGDPNARDELGNTPLHALAANKSFRSDVMRRLIDAGAHVDTVNREGRAFSELLRKHPQCSKQPPLALHQHLTLACLAARAVRRVPAYAAHVPPHLRQFVNTH